MSLSTNNITLVILYLFHQYLHENIIFHRFQQVKIFISANIEGTRFIHAMSRGEMMIIEEERRWK